MRPANDKANTEENWQGGNRGWAAMKQQYPSDDATNQETTPTRSRGTPAVRGAGSRD